MDFLVRHYADRKKGTLMEECNANNSYRRILLRYLALRKAYGGVSKPRLIESITFHESVVLCITGLQKREDDIIS